ncbi:MAG: replication protein RepA [Candidatus Eremiobacteraeota bacterium]|nr:replication protein RepA [Candidatus Eremiobacteraeota bacterium]
MSENRPVQQRLFDEIATREADGNEIGFHHSTLCQIGLPHKDPGDVRIWERQQGRARLYVQSLIAVDPRSGARVEPGLPFGEKARLMLMHFNSEAVRNQSPVVEVEDSMTAFVSSLLERKPNMREINVVRDQVARLSTSIISLSAVDGERGLIKNAQIIDTIELWYPREPSQRVLWQSRLQLATSYFEDLMQHAVPLDMRAVRALASTSLGLDLYTWLAQRLHRVPSGKPAFIPWGGANGLHTQFGHGYAALNDFKKFFRRLLVRVKAAYPEANFDFDNRGMTLHHSAPPVLKRAFSVSAPALSGE